MKSKSKVRVYIACSLDGFIAGPDGDLSWLPGADPNAPVDEGETPDPDSVDFETFFKDVGALLMGRATYDAVAGFDGPWGYGACPVLVATHRPLPTTEHDVRALTGDVSELIEEARQVAGDKDVYLDGGALIRQALDAHLVDEMILTMVPVILGEGHSLFAGTAQRHHIQFDAHHTFSHGMVQLRCRPRNTP